jgi:hypothetical protein
MGRESDECLYVKTYNWYMATHTWQRQVQVILHLWKLQYKKGNFHCILYNVSNTPYLTFLLQFSKENLQYNFYFDFINTRYGTD